MSLSFNLLDASMKHVYLVVALQVLTLQLQNPLLIITHCWAVTKSDQRKREKRNKIKEAIDD
jgi:hypothetical protein